MSKPIEEIQENICYFCHRQLGSDKAIEEHALKKHKQYLNGNYKKKVYGCSDCDFQSDLVALANRHVKSHKRA